MDGKPVNLRRWRKQKTRDQARAAGDENAARFGENPKERAAREAEEARRKAALEAHSQDNQDKDE